MIPKTESKAIKAPVKMSTIILSAVLSSMILFTPLSSAGILTEENNLWDSDYAYGFELGKLHRIAYETIISGFLSSNGSEKEEALSKASNHINYLKKEWPGLLSRYQGLADTLSVSLEEIVATSIFMGPLFLRGCTTGASAPPATDGGVYLSWNLDLWSFWGLKQLITIPPFTVTSPPGGYSYITFGVPLIAGIGLLNEKGLALVGNACGTTDSGEGLTVLEIPNLVMEKCSNVRDAAEFIEGLDRFSSPAFSLFNMNYLLADAEGGICSIEATHSYFRAAFSGTDEYHWEYIEGELIKKPGKLGILGQANHHQYLDYEVTGAPSPYADGYESSWIRAGRMWELLQENYGEINLEKVKSFTMDRENGVEVLGIEQGGFNSICRTEFPLGWIDYYIGSLTGKYIADDKPAFAHDLYVLGPDETNWALIIEPKEKIIWWAAGWPTIFPYHPVYCAPLLGVEGPSSSANDSFRDNLFNFGVRVIGSFMGIIDLVPPPIVHLLGDLLVKLLKGVASLMERLPV